MFKINYINFYCFLKKQCPFCIMSRLVNKSSKLNFLKRKYLNQYFYQLFKFPKHCWNISYFYYTRNHVSYSKSDERHIKRMFDGRTSVCCKKLGWILNWSGRFIKRDIACFLRNFSKESTYFLWNCKSLV